MLVLSHTRRALSRFASERGSLGETVKSPKGREKSPAYAYQGGETIDATVLPKPRMDELVQQRKIIPGSVVSFASAAVG